MPILKASIKDLRKSKKHALRNQAALSRLKTALKKVREAKTAADGKAALGPAIKIIDQTATKGIIPRKRADRQKSRLSAFVNKLGGKSAK